MKRAGEVVGEIERGEPCVAFSEATTTLMKAIRRMLQGCFWQHQRDNCARDLLQTVPKADQEMVADNVRSVLTQQSREA